MTRSTNQIGGYFEQQNRDLVEQNNGLKAARRNLRRKLEEVRKDNSELRDQQAGTDRLLNKIRIQKDVIKLVTGSRQANKKGIVSEAIMDRLESTLR